MGACAGKGGKPGFEFVQRRPGEDKMGIARVMGARAGKSGVSEGMQVSRSCSQAGIQAGVREGMQVLSSCSGGRGWGGQHKMGIARGMGACEACDTTFRRMRRKQLEACDTNPLLPVSSKHDVPGLAPACS